MLVNVRLVFNQWVVFVSLVQMVCVLEEEVSKIMSTVCSFFIIMSTIACRGVDPNFLPEDVQRFSGCVIVNGDLIFNRVTYDEFM